MTRQTVRLYVEESFSFRVLEPDAAVTLQRGGDPPGPRRSQKNPGARRPGTSAAKPDTPPSPTSQPIGMGPRLGAGLCSVTRPASASPPAQAAQAAHQTVRPLVGAYYYLWNPENLSSGTLRDLVPPQQPPASQAGLERSSHRGPRHRHGPARRDRFLRHRLVALRPRRPGRDYQQPTRPSRISPCGAGSGPLQVRHVLDQT